MPVIRVIVLAIAKTFSKLFGLATITFFGRAPTRDDDKLGAAGLLAVTWLPAVVAVAVPEAAEMIIPFAPDDETLLRGIAVALVVVIPVAIGLLISRVQNQPDGARATLVNLALGFLYAPVIGLLVVALVVVVPLVKISYVLRRFELQHLSIMVPTGGYDRLREHLQELLADAGIETEVDPHPWVVRQLFAGMSWTEGHIFRRGMTTRMQRLTGEVDGDWFELTMHATDLSVIGSQEAVSYVFALLSERLDPRVVYLTWDDASQRLEDEVRDCRDEIDDGRPCDTDRLEALAEELRRLALSPPEWSAVRTQIYRIQVDSEHLRARAAATKATPAQESANQAS